MELGTTISYSLGIVSGTGVVLFGIRGGIISGIIGGLIERLFSSESLKLNSNCLNYKCIPKKYREINSNLIRENVSNDTKSFVLEMVEYCFNCKWLVLNIPCHIREVKVKNTIGNTFEQYLGIEDNCSRVIFNLYELKNDKKIT